MGLFQIKCPVCGEKLPKNSKFCKHCGAKIEASSAKWYCPTCDKVIDAGSKFCPYCGAKLTDAPNVERTGGSEKTLNKDHAWSRIHGDFAQRFTLDDVKGTFSKLIEIREGERGIILVGGAYRGALNPGDYNLKDLIGETATEKQVSIVIVDAGAVQLFFNLRGLRTKDSATVSASGKVAVQLEDFPAFISNYLKQESHVSITDLEKRLENELKFIAQKVIGQYNAETLNGNVDLAAHLENEFKAVLNSDLGTYGLKILRVSFVGFDEGAWKKVTEERERQLIEVGAAKTAAEREIAIKNLEFDKRKSAIKGEAEVIQMKKDAEHQFSDSDLKHRLAQEDLISDQKRSNRVRDADTQFEIEHKQTQKDIEEVAAWSKLQDERKRKKLEREREHEKAQSEILDGESIESKIILHPEAADKLIELELRKRNASLTPEQILAQNDPKAAATVLAAKYSAEEQKEFNLRAEERANQMLEHMDNISTKAIENIGRVAAAKAGEGAKTPEVIRKCRKCGAVLPDDATFCSECGAKLI